MKVLVTGGAGYIGSVLVEQLTYYGHDVTVLDNLMYGKANLMHLCESNHFNFIHGDVRNTNTLKDSMKDVDAIFPLAAIVGAEACKNNPTPATAINTKVIKFICDMKSKNQKLIYPNTNSGYGTKSGDIYCTEETPLDPISYYGRTKVDAEKMVLDLENSYSFRLATVFGASPRMRIDLLVNDFVYKAVTDGYIIIYEKHFKRNFIHIRDVVDCFIRCLHTGLPSNLYNLGNDDENINKEELANKVKEHIPEFCIHYSGIHEDPDKRNYIVSSKKLYNDKFVPHRTINEGIKELIKCYKMFGREKHKNV